MASVKAKIKVSSKKSGTKLAEARVIVAKAKKRPPGQPLYQTRAQLNVHIQNKNGESRQRNR